jgi:hypothetical protein
MVSWGKSDAPYSIVVFRRVIWGTHIFDHVRAGVSEIDRDLKAN